MSRLSLAVLAVRALLCSQSLAHESRPNIEQAWDIVWSRLHLPSTQTFGNYLSSYKAGKERAHVPTAEEARRQHPHPCGYSTGMDDGAILGEAMLSVLCDRYEVTKDDSLREKQPRGDAHARS